MSIRTGGNLKWATAADPNVVIWPECSQAFVNILAALQARGNVKMGPQSPLTYMFDAGPLVNLPLAKRPPREGYKTPHWFPASFRPVKPTP